MQYLVHWKGYGDEHDQWIAETGLHMQNRRLKTIGRGIRVETYKDGG